MVHNFKDITGHIFGHLTALKYIGNRKWLFQCDCGNTTTVSGSNAKLGITGSCGCRRGNLRHGASRRIGRTTEYGAWVGMRKRCYDKKTNQFKDYGGRGIAVCERWLHSFENFLADVGLKPTRLHTIDRINNDGNYEPGNVRWSTRKEQQNNRRTTRMVQYLGKTQSLTAWCEELNQNKIRICSRMARGMTPQQALSIQGRIRNAYYDRKTTRLKSV